MAEVMRDELSRDVALCDRERCSDSCSGISFLEYIVSWFCLSLFTVLFFSFWFTLILATPGVLPLPRVPSFASFLRGLVVEERPPSETYSVVGDHRRSSFASHHLASVRSRLYLKEMGCSALASRWDPVET